MTLSSRKLVSLDWAIKKLLRSKADFEILEGFLSELLFEDVTIKEILESESNKDSEDDKFNCVDVKIKNSKGELIIIELQFDSEYDYFQRILYGVSKAICEQIDEGTPYGAIKKVISVNIVYFDLGQGSDYINHGTTKFHGLHNQDQLQLSTRQKKNFAKHYPSDLYPEYYVIKVNSFNDKAKDTLDEWIYFLKNEELPEKATAKGLEKAKKALSVLNLSDQQRKAYERHLEARRYARSMSDTYKLDLKYEREEGREEGRQEGEYQKAITTAKKALEKGLSIELVAELTGLAPSDLKDL